MVPEIKKAKQQQIHQALALAGHPSWAEVLHGGANGRWYRQALTSMVVALGSDDIAFVGSRGGSVSDDGFDVGGDIYTGSRLISLDARVKAPGDVEWSVTVRGISDVTAVQVHAEAEPFHETLDGEWPALTEATFVFRSGDRVTVGTTNSSERASLAGLVDEVIEGLK